MSDTNWCTFCDCAVSPFSNSIYCSEDCFKRDALLHDPLYKIYIQHQQQQRQQQSTMPEYTQTSRRDSNGNSSMCSEDLVAMHLDMIPGTPISKPTPRLSTSISPASSHNDTLLRTPPLSYNLPIYEKLTESMILLSNTAPQPKL